MKKSIILSIAILFFMSASSAEIDCNYVVADISTVLEADLDCYGPGLILQSEGTVLDCAGHTISGSGNSYGIETNGDSYMTIKNCVITGFERGISILNADNNTLANNTVSGNDYGILIQRSKVNNLTGNTIEDNTIYGLYMDNVSAGSILNDNNLCSNSNYDLYHGAPTLDTVDYPKIWGHLGIDIEPYNETTMLAGGILFDHGFSQTHIQEDRVFIEFGIARGEYLPMGDFVYHLDPDANIYATVNGTIANIGYNTHSDDYGIMIFATDYGSEYLIGIDHVLNVTVSEGDNVTAGDIIAKPGYLAEMRTEWNNDPMHDGQYYGLTEFSIVRYNHNICPATFFSDELLSSFNQSILQLISEWEEFIGDPNVHNESAFLRPGCLIEELPMIYNFDANTGGNNTCSSSYNYSDTGSSGCTNTCSICLEGDTGCDGNITLAEVIDFITLWDQQQANLEDVVDLITAWAAG